MRAAARRCARDCARARAAVGRARASATDASKSVPTYGAEDAFFIGATARSGRGAYAARALAANEVVISRERPLMWHRTVGNARSRCEWCLRASAGGATCESCADARRRAYGDFEKTHGVDLSELEAYCEKNGGLKFPLITARAASMIASGALDTQHAGMVVRGERRGNQSARAVARRVRCFATSIRRRGEEISSHPRGTLESRPVFI